MPAVAGASVALSACGPPAKPLAELPPTAQSLPSVSLLRLPRAGGAALLYRLPSLAGAEWKGSGLLEPVTAVVGNDPDQRLVFATSGSGGLVGLDLESGRPRTFLAGVTRAVVGPGGVLYAVDTALRVTAIERRAPISFRTRLPSPPRAIFGIQRGRLAALLDGSPSRIMVLEADQPPTATTGPTGNAIATAQGDLIAIATDTALVLFDPGKTTFRSLDVGGPVKAVAFSPSGHRIYVARDDDELLVFDRYSGDRVARIELPGAPGALRMAFFGDWLLARAPRGDSVWVVNLTRNELAGAVATPWAADLPIVTGKGILVARRGSDVVARDLAKAAFPITGTVTGGADDIWTTVLWSPSARLAPPRAAPETTVVAAADTGEAATAKAPAEAQVYLQVSSSQNPAWAEELVQELIESGFRAQVLDPTGPDEGYRVVIGPFTSRDEAEATGKRLGRPFFIYIPHEDDEQ